MRAEAQLIKDRLRHIMFNNGTIQDMIDYIESQSEKLYHHEIEHLKNYFCLRKEVKKN